MSCRLAFYCGTDRLLDRAIQFFTRSRFSHVELVHPDDPQLFLSSSGLDGGVRFRRLKPNPARWVFVDLEPWHHPDAWGRAVQHVGAPYDFVGILLSQTFAAKRHLKRSWFCSELVAFALGMSDPHTLSPGALYNRLQELKRTFAAPLRQ
jgi:hypothetical protein